MALSTARHTFHARSAPHHLEAVAKQLLEARARGDFSACDVTLQLRDGAIEEVHSSVICAYSTTVRDLLRHLKPPFPPIDMSSFEPNSVRRVIDWIYTGNTNIPEEKYAKDLAVTGFLKTNLLHSQIENQIMTLRGTPVRALNIATDSFTVKEETAFRPYVTKNHVQNKTLDELAASLAVGVQRGDVTKEEFCELTLNSLVSVMAAVLPRAQKVPLINCAIHWVLTHRPDTELINSITQSVCIQDVNFDVIYVVRNTLRAYLLTPELAGRAELAMSPSGVIGLRIDPRRARARRARSPGSHRASSCAPPVRTRSELSELHKIADPFSSTSSSRSRSAVSPAYERRETTDGFPKYFTLSEVENLRRMEDPFVRTNAMEAPPPVLLGEHHRAPKNNVRVANYQDVLMAAVPEPAKLEPTVSNLQCGGYSHLPAKNFAKFPGWSEEMAERAKARHAAKKHYYDARFTRSEMEEMRDLSDPFLPSRASSSPSSSSKIAAAGSKSSTSNFKNAKPSGFGGTSPVVVMAPSYGGFGGVPALSGSCSKGWPSKEQQQQLHQQANLKQKAAASPAGSGWNARNKRNDQSWKERTPSRTAANNNARADFIVTSSSSSSTAAALAPNSCVSLQSAQKHTGVRKTASEIDEINAHPPIASSSASAASFNNYKTAPEKTPSLQHQQQQQHQQQKQPEKTKSQNYQASQYMYPH